MTDSPTFTERRLFRPAELVMEFQSEGGAPPFSLSDARTLPGAEVLLDPGYTKDDFQGTAGSSFKRGEGRVTMERRPFASVKAPVTPNLIEYLLRSWGGSWSGSPKVFSFREGGIEYATLGLIEKTPIPNNQKLWRFWDGWAYRVALSMASGLSILEASTDFAFRDFDRTTLSLAALGAAEITLPTSVSVVISQVHNSNPCKITTATAHGFSTGDIVCFTDVVGTIELNQKTYQITVVNATEFTLDGISGILFLPFSSGHVRKVSNAPPTGLDVFAPHQFRLFRDPDGANVSIAVEEFVIEFASDVSQEVWNDYAPQVVNVGYNAIKVKVRGIWQDETLAIETDAETLATTFKRFLARWRNGSKELLIDLKNVDWKPSATGWSGKRFNEFEIEGEAFLDEDGVLAEITLTP